MRLTKTPACRATVLAFVTGIIVAASAVPASAAVPANDSYSDRTVIGALPFSTIIDTSEATTDAADAELNASCGAPITDASVWYEVTAATDDGMVVDVSRSTYSAGAIVVTGAPGAWTLVGCAPVGFSWRATAGSTYTILVFDDQLDGGGNGGTAAIDIAVNPPPLEFGITVNPRAQFTKSGEAIVSGTMTCSAPVDVSMEVALSQRFGRVILRGATSLETVCDGTARPWSIRIVAYYGKFAGGKAASVTFAYACGVFDCGFDYVERTVQLSHAS